MPIPANTIVLPNPVTPAEPLTFGSLPERVRFGDGIGGFGAAPLTTPGTPHHAGGVWGGRQREGAQSVTIDAPWTDDPNVLMALRALMGAHPDPSDLIDLRWQGLGFPDEHSMLVRPDGYETYADEDAVEGGVWVLRLRFLAEDPTVWSADPTVVNRTASGGHSFTATNSGTRTVQASALRGAWSLVLTASGGSVTSPWVQIAGRRVTWQGLTVPSGESLTVTRDRQSTLSPTGAPVNGYARTPGEAAPHWPVLAPGSSTVTMGCASGSFTVAWSHWSSW